LVRLAKSDEITILNDLDNSCILTRNINNDFIADTVILETCGWSWSSTDAVQLCGKTDNIEPPQPNISNIIQICDWKYCKSAAASISVDDSFASCREKLNQYGFKGTFYLSSTDDFNQDDWELWNDIYQEGHEIASHTNSHSCSVSNKEFLRYDIESNINDIFDNINGINESELIGFAWPCGVTDIEAKNIAKDYFLYARGYHTNILEDKNPADFMYIKNLNTPNYHEPYLEPPNYYQMADQAVEEGKWINYVFHNQCNEPEIIDYVSTKDIWADSIGNVIKYIVERQNVNIGEFYSEEDYIEFVVENELDYTIFNEELTFKININEMIVESVKADTKNIPFSYKNGYIIFNIFPDDYTLVEIELEENNNLNLCNRSDINKDGNVDNADYILWRKYEGCVVSTNPICENADINNDGVVNQLDYNLWKSYFGIDNC